MLVQNFKKYLILTKKQIKLSTRKNLVLALIFLLLTPVICSVKNLDAFEASRILERFVSIIGIVLLTPVFLPEQDKNVKEVVESKFTAMTGVYLIRLILGIITLIAIISVFIKIMLINNCDFSAFDFILGTVATALFLGSLGVLAYSISDNIVVGYLIPIAYFMLNFFSKDKLKNLYLFSLSENSLTEKYYLLCFSMLLIIIAISYKSILRKTR